MEELKGYVVTLLCARCTTDMRDNHVTNDTGGGGDDDDDDDDDDDNHDDDDDEFYGLQQQA